MRNFEDSKASELCFYLAVDIGTAVDKSWYRILFPNVPNEIDCNSKKGIK